MSRRPACTAGDSACVIHSAEPAQRRDRGSQRSRITPVQDRRRARGQGPHQRPVRRQGQPGLRDRGQPPGQSRTVPFVAKATGVPLAKVASRVMVGATLEELRSRGSPTSIRVEGDHIAVKEAVLPFNRFPEADAGARTGDALDRRGHGNRPHAGARLRDKSQISAQVRELPEAGTIFMSLADRDKAVPVIDGGSRSSRISDSLSRRPAVRLRHLREATGFHVAVDVAKLGEDRTESTRCELIQDGQAIQMVINSPARPWLPRRR